jgi:hypothetical protein
VLGVGGAIDGVVRDADGRAVAGAIVAISRADGFPRTVRVAADGAFRFDRLTPGPWWVGLHERELSPDRHETITRSGGGNVEWTTLVREGHTSRVDPSTVPRRGVALSGRLRLDGAPAVGWTGALMARDARSGEHGDDVILDGEGRFAVHAPRAGAWRLVLTAPTADWVLFAETELSGGETPWSLDVVTGSLEVLGVPAESDVERPIAVVFDLAAGVTALGRLVPDADGAATLTGVPAGAARVCELPRKVEGPLDTGAWVVLGRAQIPVGGRASLRLDR